MSHVALPLRTNYPVLIAVLLCFIATTCFAADTIRISGSGSAIDMLKPIVAAYQKNNRNIRFEIGKPLGSSGAISSLLAGSLEIAVVSRALMPEEAAKGTQLRVFGKTPLGVVTEKSIPKTNITTNELEDIYAGRITKWHNGESIRIVLRPRDDINTRILRALSTGMDAAVNASQSRPGMIIAVTDTDAYTTISKTPGGVGTTCLTSLITEKPLLNLLTLNGVAATRKNLVSGTYPIFKEINFVTGATTTPEAQKFINFIFSLQGRAIATKTGVYVTAGKKELTSD